MVKNFLMVLGFERLPVLKTEGLLFNHEITRLLIEITKSYTSNNPLAPDNFETAPFENHNILKFKLDGTIRFGQKYLSYPGSKFNITNPKYPKLNFSFEKGLGATTPTIILII